MGAIRDKHGKVIRRGQNLAFLRRYISETYRDYTVNRWARRIILTQGADGSAHLSISFIDGAGILYPFASFEVLCGVVDRWINLRGIERIYRYYHYSNDGRHIAVMDQDGKLTQYHKPVDPPAYGLYYADQLCALCHTMIMYDDYISDQGIPMHSGCIYAWNADQRPRDRYHAYSLAVKAAQDQS